MPPTLFIVFLTVLTSYFLLIIYCNFETRWCSKSVLFPNNTDNNSPQQICVRFYTDYLMQNILKRSFDAVIHIADSITNNIHKLTMSFIFAFGIYGWIFNNIEMRQCLRDVYLEIKQTTVDFFHEICSITCNAIMIVWTSIPIQKTLQLAFLLLLLMSVPEFLDYLKKTLIRVVKLWISFYIFLSLILTSHSHSLLSLINWTLHSSLI